MPLEATAAPTGPDTSAATAGVLAPDADVAEAQALMSELGLWEGAADGQPSAAFGRAVRRARGVLGLALDVLRPVDEDLLSTLRGRAEARRTARQLTDARAREEAAARAAIAASPVLSQALDTPAKPAPEPDPEACRAAPTVDCLLDLARRAAAAVTDGELRNWGLGRVARARVAASGVLEDAWPALRLADDPRAVFTALAGIAVEAAEAGRADLALQAVGAMDALPATAARAAAEAAAALAGADQPGAETLAERAEDLLPRLSDPADRRPVLAGLALAAHAAGETARATALLAQAQGAPETLAPAWAAVGGAAAVAPLLHALADHADPAARRAVLMDLADAHAREGTVADAVTAAEAVEEPRYRAVALAGVAGAAGRSDLLERAEAVAREITLPFARAFALAHVADGWLTLDRPDRARAVAGEIETDTLAVPILERIARHPAADAATAADAEQTAEALRRAMVDRVARARLWAERARALAVSDPAAARVAARAAVDRALDIRNRWNAARALLHAAGAVAALQAPGLDGADIDPDVDGAGGR